VRSFMIRKWRRQRMRRIPKYAALLAPERLDALGWLLRMWREVQRISRVQQYRLHTDQLLHIWVDAGCPKVNEIAGALRARMVAMMLVEAHTGDDLSVRERMAQLARAETGRR